MKEISRLVLQKVITNPSDITNESVKPTLEESEVVVYD